jgi:hypothetical protein
MLGRDPECVAPSPSRLAPLPFVVFRAVRLLLLPSPPLPPILSPPPEPTPLLLLTLPFSALLAGKKI